jgi:hypothetical protein
VFSKILQHVDECVTHLARRRERPRVISVGPHLTAPSEEAIGRLGDAYRKALEAAPERDVSVAFDEQMDVIGLHAELEQAE